ncbi:membrane protein insertion efficiency factor YidD [Patescibacteria group bacterium]|nr:membrane protein insertion efficiency factor YidD [Patescibacteria group bacterium]MBU1907461.1 membrane protein insertion efficiency factor YidD [Patescibacteria group bacterium]
MLQYIPKYTAMACIRVYQRTLSFDHGLPRHLFPHGYCRFHPTCSEYGYQAIGRHGLVKGGLMTLWRVLRCNPWNQGGIDEVSEKK